MTRECRSAWPPLVLGVKVELGEGALAISRPADSNSDKIVAGRKDSQILVGLRPGGGFICCGDTVDI